MYLGRQQKMVHVLMSLPSTWDQVSGLSWLTAVVTDIQEVIQQMEDSHTYILSLSHSLLFVTLPFKYIKWFFKIIRTANYESGVKRNM